MTLGYYIKIGMFLATQFRAIGSPAIFVLDDPVPVYNIMSIARDSRPAYERLRNPRASDEYKTTPIELASFRMPDGRKLLCGHHQETNTFIIYIEGYKPGNCTSIPDSLKREFAELMETISGTSKSKV